MTDFSDTPASNRPGPQRVSPAEPPPSPTAASPSGAKNGLGITALVVAVAGLATSFTVVGGIGLGIAAVVFGFIARDRVGRGEATNRGVATTGVALGVLAVVSGLVFVVIWIAFWASIWNSNDGDYLDCLEKAGPVAVIQQQCAEEFHEELEGRIDVTLTPPAPTS